MGLVWGWGGNFAFKGQATFPKQYMNQSTATLGNYPKFAMQFSSCVWKEDYTKRLTNFHEALRKEILQTDAEIQKRREVK